MRVALLALHIACCIDIAVSVCPPSHILNRIKTPVGHVMRDNSDEDPYVCISEHLRMLTLAFSHALTYGQSEAQRGYGSNRTENIREMAACRARIRKDKQHAGDAVEVEQLIKAACFSNAGGDTLLANREFYDLHLSQLAPRRNVSVLCVGVFRGESLAVWSDWFQHGRIVGLDVNLEPAAAYRETLVSKGAFQNDNVVLIETDTTSASKFAATRAAYPDVFARGFDVILDDGCHTTVCILQTFDNVNTLLRPGGIYVVEDNADHLEVLRRQRQWASFAFKDGRNPDSLGTPGNSHHTYVAAYHLPHRTREDLSLPSRDVRGMP